MAVALPYLHRRGHHLWPLLDAAAPGLAIGIAIGRLGDLVVADHLGKPTDFLLGYRCTGAETASPCVAPVGQAVHQPALYDLAAVLMLLGLLLFDLDADPDMDPTVNHAGCYLITEDAEAWHARMFTVGLPVTPLADQPWGMREFTLTDPSGNQVRIGRGLPDD